ncbi:hypothetical protein BDR07DRAFT_1382517 [Suillus spraguei]|nr:hypothetical protein BDR07DRAFT_1382517 [Suillus spraguei]
MSLSGSFIKLPQMYSKLSTMNLDTTSSKALLGSGWSPPPSITSSPCIQLEAQKSVKSSNICLLDKVITNITPAEYAVVLAFVSEESDFGIRAKFNYFQDMQELQIMTPLPIHEQPTTHLFKAVTKYTDGISYNKRLIDVTLHLNHCMQNKDFTNIPDLQLLVATHPPEGEDDEAKIEMLRPISKWVGNPKDNSVASQILRASPTLDHEDFIPHHIKKSLKFGPHGADNHFNFSSKNAETFTEGTIYPEIKMDNVECMLSEAAGSLKEYIISLLEGMGLEEPAIRSARESRPVWDPMREAVVNQISTAVYPTAYCRYVDWHHHRYDKRKSSHQEVTQATSTSLLSSDPTAGSSSNLTTSSSTDQLHMPSTGLLIDIEPAHLAKKAKVDNRKVPKAKTKKSKSKKAKGQVKNL